MRELPFIGLTVQNPWPEEGLFFSDSPTLDEVVEFNYHWISKAGLVQVIKKKYKIVELEQCKSDPMREPNYLCRAIYILEEKVK